MTHKAEVRHFAGEVKYSRGRLRLELTELHNRLFVTIRRVRFSAKDRAFLPTSERLHIPLADYKALVAVVKWVPGLVRRATAETQAAIASTPDPEPYATADGPDLADATRDWDTTDSAELLARVQELKRAGRSRGDASVQAFQELAARKAARRYLP